MRRTTLRIAAAAISSVLVLGASATAASAAPATFSTTGPISTGLIYSLVLKIGTTPTPATTVTCTRSSFYPAGDATNTGTPAQGRLNNFDFYAPQNCVTGTGQTAVVSVVHSNSPMLATKTGTAYSLSGTSHWNMQILLPSDVIYSAPGFGPASYSASWINYPAPANSLLVFDNAPVGRVLPGPGSSLGGQPITLTAKFFVTQNGTNITLI